MAGDKSYEAEIYSLHSKIGRLTTNLDKMYRLVDLLVVIDCVSIYQRVKMENSSLEEKLKELEAIS